MHTSAPVASLARASPAPRLPSPGAPMLKSAREKARAQMWWHSSTITCRVEARASVLVRRSLRVQGLGFRV